MKKLFLLLFVLLAVLPLSAQDAEFYFNRGNEYFTKVDFDRAIEDYSRAIALNPGDFRFWTFRGMAYRLKGEFDRSIDDLNKAVALSPGNLGILSFRGDSYREKGELDKAIEDYNKAIAFDPNIDQAYSGRGLAYSKKGEFGRAIEDINKAISLDPSDISFLGNRGSIYLEKGDLDLAIADFSKVISVDSNEAGAWNNRGVVYKEKGELDLAIADFDKAISLNPNVADVWNNRGAAYHRKGELDRAIEDLNRAIALNPNDFTYFLNRGSVYRTRNEANRAFDDINRAISLNQNSAEAWNSRGVIYREMNILDRAIEDFSKAINLNPNKAKDYLINRGTAYRIKGDFDKAIEDYSRVIALDPNNAPALNNRANAYAEKKDINRAIADYDKAISINPNIAHFWYSRGDANLYKGEANLANRDYRQSIEVADKSSNIMESFFWAWQFTGSVYKTYPFLGNRISANDININLAREALSRSITRAEKVRSSLGARGTEIMTGQLYQYYAGVDLEASFGTAGNAFTYSEELRSRGFLEQMSTEAALRLPGIADTDAQKVRNLTREIGNYQELLIKLDSQLEGDLYAAAGSSLTKAEAALAALDIQIAAKIPHYEELRNPKTASLAEAQAFCGNDRVVLEYVLWDSSIGFKAPTIPAAPSKFQDRPSINSYCLVITKDGITPVRLDHNLDCSAKIKDLREKLYYIWRGAIVTGKEEDFEEERNALYNALIKPVLANIPNNTKNILIVPDGDLAFLPFDILRESNRPEDRNLGERFNISLSPSVSCSIIAKRYNIPMVEPIIAFGGVLYRPEDERRNANTVATDSESRLAALDKSLGDYRGSPGQGPQEREKAEDFYKRKPWSYLAWTVAEVQGLQRIATEAPRIIQGREASMQNVKQLSLRGTLLNYPIIHFACHGFFDDDLMPQAALVLSEVSGLLRNESREDGYLSIEEIALLNLRARMVMLSACETGRGHVKRGDGMIGMARSFMVAGAQSVGVSLWEISDEATTEFMWGVYRKVIREKKSFRDAYSEVKEEFRNSENWGHPYYWAGFTFYE